MQIMHAESESAIEEVRDLFAEYVQTVNCGCCLVGFEREMEGLPRGYEPPLGYLFLATAPDGSAVGCVGIRRFKPGIAVMKRLFVRPEWRRQGVGRHLVTRANDWARQAGYQRMHLETADTMVEARALYRTMGFQDLPPPMGILPAAIRLMDMALV
ncbi:MAG: GNAT family N-acetyltransferase [Magnetococcus sp. DMHC-1]|nr:GNAT family N-acetyltransferase [Magnetococcales bacterium]